MYMASDGLERVFQKVRAEATKVARTIEEEGFNSKTTRVVSIATKQDVYAAIYNVCPLSNDTTRWEAIGNLFIKIMEDYIAVVTKSCEGQSRKDSRILLEYVCTKYQHYCVYLKMMAHFFMHVGRWVESIPVLSSLLETGTTVRNTERTPISPTSGARGGGGDGDGNGREKSEKRIGLRVKGWPRVGPAAFSFSACRDRPCH